MAFGDVLDQDGDLHPGAILYAHQEPVPPIRGSPQYGSRDF
jgi:hypothetical protein